MVRWLLFVLLLGAATDNACAQYTVYKDENGYVVTKVDSYDVGAVGTGHTQILYAGSPFLNFPVWQPAIIRLDKRGQELTCELAYNLVTNEVLCRFAGDKAVKTVTPETFTIGNVTYVRQPNKSIGVRHQSYFMALHGGPTKLLASFSKQLKASYTGSSGYDKDLNVKGFYQTNTTYYIQKGNAYPEFISLSKKSVLDVLYEQADKLAAELPDKQLTPEKVIKALLQYDSLMTVVSINKPPLSNDPVFNQSLHDKISYPNLAWRQGIYGRVYAGFDITAQGTVKNIVLLSPENAGFGFAETVVNALAKLPRTNPAFQGRYALPVAFTYANATEKASPHVPVNQLPADRLAERLLLTEFVVPVIVDKPTVNSREVWGYYK